MPSARVRTLDEALAHPQLHARSVLSRADSASGQESKDVSPDRKTGVSIFARKAWNTVFASEQGESDTGHGVLNGEKADSHTVASNVVVQPAMAGQHNELLLSELGFTDSEITSMKENGAI